MGYARHSHEGNQTIVHPDISASVRPIDQEIAAMENSKNGRPRGENRRKRHSEVLAAATRVFHLKGYDGTTIQDIADELGILKGSVYYYVTSKEDILYEVLDEIHRAGFTTALRAVEAGNTPLEHIHSFVSALSEFNARNPARMAVLLREIHILKPDRQKNIVRERDRYEEILRELITEGQAEGLISDDINPKITTRAIMGMVNSIHQWYRSSGGMKPEMVGRAYGDLAIRTLTGTPNAALIPAANEARSH